MKKNVLLLTAVLCTAAWANAQVIQSYDFGSTVGTYEEITDGTIISQMATPADGEATNVEFDNIIFYPDSVATENTELAGYPIGFDFEYNDVISNQFAVSPFGYITVGRDKVWSMPSAGAFGFNRDFPNIMGVAPNADIINTDSTTISYKTIGEAGSQALVVQYKNLGIKVGWDDDEIQYVNLQLRLYEADGKIEFVFDSWNTTISYSKMVRIGLRGGLNDIHTREGDDWTNTTKATNAASLRMGADYNVPNGLTFTFTMPAACETPTAQPTDLVLTSTSNMMEGSFTKTDAADHFLVLYSLEEELTELPQSGTYYKAEDVIGNAIVLQYDTISTFATDEILESAKSYYFTVFAANSYCKHGPAYNTDAPLKGSFATKPAVPVALEITTKATDRFVFSVTANEVDQVMVALTDSLYEPIQNYGFEPYFGTPTGSYEVGDSIEGGGVVVYIGGSAEGIVAEGLAAGRGHILRAFSMNANNEYSTLFLDARGATYGTLPYKLDLSREAKYEMPIDWTETGGSFRIDEQNMNTLGTEDMQLNCNIGGGNAAAGTINTLTTQPIVMTQRDAAVTFGYSIATKAGRFGAMDPYNDWHELDTLAIQVSTDGGVNFTDLKVYNSKNNLKQDTITHFVMPEADLTEYVNDTIQIRIYWRTHMTGFSNFMVIEQFSIAGREIPVIPVVAVEDVTFNSALVTWRGGQESYEFASCKEGEEWTTVVTTEKQMELVDLTHETNYQVKVRGIVAENDTTEWSEVVTFTTAELPECPVPTDLNDVTDNDAKTTTISWTGTEEHISWDIHYRPASVTSWTTIEGLVEDYYTLTDLEPETTYLWSVRASCTFDRTSRWATQDDFISAESAISFATADDLKVVARDNRISIINNGIFIKNVAVCDLQGRVINYSDINCDVNVLMPIHATGVVLVKVTTLDKQFVYKVRVQ